MTRLGPAPSSVAVRRGAPHWAVDVSSKPPAAYAGKLQGQELGLIRPAAAFRTGQHPEGGGRRRHLRGMLAAVTGSAPPWRTALGELPIVRGGRWAVGGSASLALHGLPVDPRDLDLLVDHVAAAELVDGLGRAVVSDEARWDRGDVRAIRRALAVVHDVEVEILEGVEAVGPAGDVVVATPDLDQVDRIIVGGRPIPVLPLPVMQVLLDATGNRERAAMIAKVLGGADDTQESWR